MSGGTDDFIGAAHEALVAGDWPTAKTSFEAALEREVSAEALLGLGNALWWLGETEASVRYQERAYAEFRRRQDPSQAALAAIHLCLTYSASLGNHFASRGWLGRAARLVDQHRMAAALGGWVLLCRAVAASDSSEPSAAERWAREALEAARRQGDADLELCALSQIGVSLVEQGQVEEGVALLDEAMAGCLGGEGALDTVVFTCCSTIICCSRAADVERAVQWIRAADDFTRRYGSPHLYTVCRTHYGSILFATGKWADAERELAAALRAARTAEPALHAEALAKLAELRLAQGRIEEAARLVEGFEDHAATAYVVSAVRLGSGEPAVAASILRRRLSDVGEHALGSGALLELLAEAEIEQGVVEEAAARARRLETLGVSLRCDPIVARGERTHGRVLAATGDHDRAIPCLERALATFARLGMPFETGRTRLLLATALGEGDRATAVAESRTALATFEALGAARDADRAAAFLRSLGVKAARSGGRGVGLLSKRELEVLGLLGEGLSNRELAERLFITRKTVEHHVARVLSKLELSGRAEAAAYAVRHLKRDSATQ